MVKILQHATRKSDDKQTLKKGQSLISKNKHFFLVMQDDGNLVMYKHYKWESQHAVWATGTNGKGFNNYVRMQDDGNLVIYDGNDKPVWASNSNGKGEGPFTLRCQDDGNVVIYDRHDKPTWASNSVQNLSGWESRDNHLFSEAKIIHNGSLHSNNKKTHVRMQEDGNLVVYNQHNKPLWASNTQNKGSGGNYKLYVQDDGNVVIYDSQKKPTWASNTNGQGQMPYRLIMQDDGNLVLYDYYDKPLWATNTQNH